MASWPHCCPAYRDTVKSAMTAILPWGHTGGWKLCLYVYYITFNPHTIQVHEASTVLSPLYRWENRLRRLKIELLIDGNNTLSKHVNLRGYFLNQYTFQPPPQNIISFVFRDRSTGSLRIYWKTSRFTEGKLSSLRFQFKLASELTMHTSNKGFIVGHWVKYKAMAGTKPNPMQFSKHLLKVYRASLGQLAWVFFLLCRNSSKGQSYGIPYNQVLQRVTWAAELLRNGKRLRQWKYLVPPSITLGFDTPEKKTQRKTLGG